MAGFRLDCRCDAGAAGASSAWSNGHLWRAWPKASSLSSVFSLSCGLTAARLRHLLLVSAFSARKLVSFIIQFLVRPTRKLCKFPRHFCNRVLCFIAVSGFYKKNKTRATRMRRHLSRREHKTRERPAHSQSQIITNIISLTESSVWGLLFSFLLLCSRQCCQSSTFQASFSTFQSLSSI